MVDLVKFKVQYHLNVLVILGIIPSKITRLPVKDIWQEHIVIVTKSLPCCARKVTEHRVTEPFSRVALTPRPE